jgi:hypothetical protein
MDRENVEAAELVKVVSERGQVRRQLVSVGFDDLDNKQWLVPS